MITDVDITVIKDVFRYFQFLGFNSVCVVSESFKMCQAKEGKAGKRAIQWKEGKIANDVMKASFYTLRKSKER